MQIENRRQFPVLQDDRGSLLPIDFNDLDLSPKRVFVVTGTEGGCTRGGHGPRSGSQWLVLVGGQVNVLVRRSGQAAQLTRLVTEGEALRVDQGEIAWQRYADQRSCLMVISDTDFQPDGYINPTEPLSEAEMAMLSKL